MLKISKLSLAAALAAVIVASPALAQSFNPRDGTGNAMPLQYEGDGGRSAWTVTQPKQLNVQVAARKSGSAEQVAARKNGNSVHIAGGRTTHHGA